MNFYFRLLDFEHKEDADYAAKQMVIPNEKLSLWGKSLRGY